MEKENSIGEAKSETKEKNADRGLALCRTIAHLHENELRQQVKDNMGFPGGLVITEGPLTTEQLVHEFEEAAVQGGIDLENFYAHVAQLKMAGMHRFEATALFQIVTFHREQQKKNEAEEVEG